MRASSASEDEAMLTSDVAKPTEIIDALLGLISFNVGVNATQMQIPNIRISTNLRREVLHMIDEFEIDIICQSEHDNRLELGIKHTAMDGIWCCKLRHAAAHGKNDTGARDKTKQCKRNRNQTKQYKAMQSNPG